MDRTRLALIGVGMIGKRHLKAMGEVPESELVALVDTIPFYIGSSYLNRYLQIDPMQEHDGNVESTR